PLPGMPVWNALTITGLPRMTATTFSFRLIPMACHDSYPRKSENARPPGTFTVYLSCAELAKTPKRASHTAIPIVHMLLRFMATPSRTRRRPRASRTPPGGAATNDFSRLSSRRRLLLRGRGHPLLDLSLRLAARDAVTLLHASNELLGTTLNDVDIIRRELAPFFPDFTLELRPLSFERVFVHVVPLTFLSPRSHGLSGHNCDESAQLTARHDPARAMP